MRALVVSPDGKVWGSGSSPLVSRRDRVRHEQDPERWWSAFAEACRGARRDAPFASLGAVALCATSGTVALVDSDGDPLSPGLMYDDTRAGEESERVTAALGVPASASWGLPKLLWLLERAGPPAGAVLAHPADFVARRLTGHRVPTDWSQALKSGYDLRQGRWPDEALATLGIGAAVMPEVVPPGTPLGVVSAAAAAATGIPAGTLVIAGLTDGCAAQLATGALEVGDWSSTLGTTLVVKGVAQEPISDPAGALYCHRLPDGRWLPGGASSTGGGVLEAHFPGRNLAELDRAVAQEPSGLLVYPLRSRGERFPFLAPGAEAFTVGEPAGDADLYTALLQGIAYVERLCFDYVNHLGAPVDGALSLTGGATRSRRWCQLRADVLSRPLRLVERPEPAFGMAVLAAAEVGGRDLAEVAAKMVRVEQVIDPRPDRARAFVAPYLRLVDELEWRRWLAPEVAEHARARAG